MKIISIRKGEKNYYGFVEKEKLFTRFSTNEGNIVFGESYPKNKYRNYEHYVGVMSKFDPYTFFLEKPIEIEKLDYANIEKAWKQIKGKA